ncbi:MAG: hypothetical protein MRZ66_02200 [Clostridiales bacterium]|nr:hypothetical protein [Clostridiales bacterium]
MKISENKYRICPKYGRDILWTIKAVSAISNGIEKYESFTQAGEVIMAVGVNYVSECTDGRYF